MEMTINEAISEFRRIAREYRAMAKMEEVVETLAEPVLLKQKLDAEVAKLNSIKAALSDEVQLIKTEINNIVSSKNKAIEDLEALKVLKQAEAERIIGDAKTKAKEIINAGNNEVAKLEETLTNLTAQKVAMQAEIKAYDNTITAMKERVASMKRGIKEQFGI